MQRPATRRGRRRAPGSELTASGVVQRWQIAGWFERSSVLKGLGIALAVLVLMVTLELFKRTWIDAPAAEAEVVRAAGDVHPDLLRDTDPNRID